MDRWTAKVTGVMVALLGLGMHSALSGELSAIRMPVFILAQGVAAWFFLVFLKDKPVEAAVALLLPLLLLVFAFGGPFF